jgi:hypothetical protein
VAHAAIRPVRGRTTTVEPEEPPVILDALPGDHAVDALDGRPGRNASEVSLDDLPFCSPAR